MKKMLSLICALALLGGLALAEEPTPGQELHFDSPLRIDLNADGQEETVQVFLRGLVEEEYLQLGVTGADGSYVSYDTDIKYVYGMYVVDIDGDGVQEILLTGDLYSDDYCTWCLRYDGNALVPVPFEDANRDENTGGLFDYGYGVFTALDGLNLTLTGSQDVLGTWMASRTFTLRDGVFRLEDGGLWQMAVNTEDPYLWEYGSLNPLKELKVTLADGSPAVLAAGEKFVVTQSDKVSIVHFTTKDAKSGSFPIEPDLENGWGSLIEGVNEYEWFEYVPYAD